MIIELSILIWISIGFLAKVIQDNKDNTFDIFSRRSLKAMLLGPLALIAIIIAWLYYK